MVIILLFGLQNFQSTYSKYWNSITDSKFWASKPFTGYLLRSTNLLEIAIMFSFTEDEQSRFDDILRNECLDDFVYDHLNMEFPLFLEWCAEVTINFDTIDCDRIATQSGSIEALKILQSKGYKLYVTDILSMAAEHGHLEIIKWLRGEEDKAADEQMLKIATRAGHFHIVKWLIKEGCSYTSGDLEYCFWEWLSSITP